MFTVLDDLLQTLFPSYCRGCFKAIPTKTTLCLHCLWETLAPSRWYGNNRNYPVWGSKLLVADWGCAGFCGYDRICQVSPSLVLKLSFLCSWWDIPFHWFYGAWSRYCSCNVQSVETPLVGLKTKLRQFCCAQFPNWMQHSLARIAFVCILTSM